MVWKPSDVYQVNKEYALLKEANGLWRGVCEFNLDPKGLGRIKVRIPAIHGAAYGGAANLDSTADQATSGGGVSIKGLSWAWPCTKGSGGVLDSGEYDIPLIGAGVWIMFEQGDPNYPVWVGTWPAIPEEEQEANTISGWNIPDVPTSMGKWMQEPGLSTPKETHEQTNNDPQVRVLAKTPKGATILAIDTDSAETLMIIDRAGQMIEMYSPVTATKNEGNGAQRGLKTARDEDSLDPSTYCTDDNAYIRIIDTSYKNNQWVGQFLKLSAKKDSQVVRLHGAAGHDIYLDSTKDAERIVIKDNKGNFIYIDKDSNLKIKVKEDQKITVEGNVVMDVQGDCTYKTKGTYEIDCENFIVKAKTNLTLSGKTASLKTDGLKISSANSMELAGGSLKLGSKDGIALSCPGAASIAAATVDFVQGGSAPTPDSPDSPAEPEDPAGEVTIPPETFPIG